MPAIGGRNNGKAHIDAWFDVYEWGGRPGDRTTGSVDRALEAIRNYIINVRDAGVRGTRSSPAIIYFPPAVQPWYLQRSFFVERPFWEIRGGGREQTKVRMPVGNLAPCFIFGMPRGPQDSAYAGYDGTNPLFLDAGHWVDGHGVLDSSAASAAGQRWGLRLKNDSVVSCPLTPFSHGIGDGWALTRQMTVEFFIDPGAGLQFGNDALFGTGEQTPSPWYFATRTPNIVQFLFAVTGANQPASQYAQFSLGAAAGPMKITFQIDLINGTSQAWVNGVQVAVTLGNASTFTAANGMSFVRNDYLPFNIGKRCLTVINQDSSATVDHTYYGLQVSNRLVYADSMGNPLARVDTHAITDLNRYFDAAGSVGYLALTDPPRGNSNCYNDGRQVKITGSSTVHGAPFAVPGYFLNNLDFVTPILGYFNRISDIDASNGSALQSQVLGKPPGAFITPFGQAIAIGAVNEMHIDNVNASGYGQGVGSLNTGANYTHYINDLVCEGGDAGYYGYCQSVDVDRIKVSNQGRAGIRFASAGGIVRNTFFGDTSAGTEAAIRLHGGEYGGGYQFEYLTYDNEFGGGPMTAMLLCDAASFAPATLRITNLNVGVVPDNNVLIWLRDVNPYGNGYAAPDAGHGPHTFTLDGMACYGATHAAHIRTDGTLWNGTVENVQAGYGGYRYLEAVPMFDNTGPGGLGRVVHKSRDYNMPPRGGKWDANCHVLEMQLPAPGQYATLRCVRSGVMNTGTPPLWCGSGTLDDGSGNLAAVGPANYYFTPITLTS